MKESSKFIPNSAHFPSLCRIIGIVLVLVMVGIIHPPALLCAEPGDLVPQFMSGVLGQQGLVGFFLPVRSIKTWFLPGIYFENCLFKFSRPELLQP